MVDNEDIYNEVKALRSDVAKYHNRAVRNSTDIAWLKRGLFGVVGSMFTYAGAVIWTKINGH